MITASERGSGEEAIAATDGRGELLDFSRTRFRTGDQIQDALTRVPDLRMRPEKVRDSDASYCLAKRVKKVKYPFMSPIPASMEHLRMEEFRVVDDIDWKMLTLRRPQTKNEEEVFSRIVEMERCRLKSSSAEAAVLESLRKKPHVAKCAKDAAGNQEVYRYEQFARDRKDNRLAEEDKSAEYVRRVTELLSTSTLKGDFTQQIINRKIKSQRSLEEAKERNAKRDKKKMALTKTSPGPSAALAPDSVAVFVTKQSSRVAPKSELIARQKFVESAPPSSKKTTKTSGKIKSKVGQNKTRKKS